MQENNLEKALLVDRVVMVPREMYDEGILLEAAESTQDLWPGVDGEWITNNLRIQALLGSPEVTSPSASYQQRLKVMFRMLEMIENEWRTDIMLVNENWEGD